MRLSAILLALIALTHYGYEPIASLFGQQATQSSIFYILRGYEGLALFAFIGILARRVDVAAVCVWGMVEEGQTAICRLAVGLTSQVSVPPYTGVCGRGMYWIGIVAAALLALFVARELKNERNDRDRSSSSSHGG